MSTNGMDLPNARVIAIRLPDGDSEFWMTEVEFTIGQRLWCKGRPWLVAEVASARETGTHPRVTLREPEGEGVAATRTRTQRRSAIASHPFAPVSAEGDG